MLELTSSGKYSSRRNRQSYLINLEFNHLPHFRKEINAALLNKEVKIDEQYFIVVAIELNSSYEEFYHPTAGLVVKSSSEDGVLMNG